MSVLIDNILRDRKYDLTINVRGAWNDGGNKMDKFGYTIKIHNVTLASYKTYKRYDGAQIAARKLIHKLEQGVNK